MEVLSVRCAGLDVHAHSVTACLRLAAGAVVTYEHRTVATTTAGLLRSAAWLDAAGCTHVAMEATGVYWKPSGTSSRASARSSWPMPSAFAPSRAARATSTTRRRLPTCLPMP